MCIICLEISARRMKSYEAKLARVELQHLIPEEHEREVDLAIQLVELKEQMNSNIEEAENE